MLKPLSAALAAVLAIASAPAFANEAPQGAARFAHDPYPSTYAPIASAPVLIRGATVLTGTGERLDGADVLLVGGRIEAVGPGLQAPEGATVVFSAHGVAPASGSPPA